jgi:hypothetical protein
MSTKTKTVRNTPADPTLPKVPIEVAGATFHLVWDFNSFATAEAVTGQNVLQSLNFDGISSLQLRALLFAALLKLQPEITVIQAGNLLRDESTTLRIIDALVEAYHGSMPKPKDENESPNVGAPEPVN